MNIRIEYVFPPIPDRNRDWCAYFDPESGVAGWGATWHEAVRDLLDSTEHLESDEL